MTLIDELLSQTKYGRKELARQEFIVSVTEQIWEMLEEKGLNKADLARLLETSRSNVTQLLNGNRNLTLSTLADIGEALGAKPQVVFNHHVVTHQEKSGFSSKAATSVSQRGLPKEVFNYEFGAHLQKGGAAITPAPGTGKSSAMSGGPFVVMAG